MGIVFSALRRMKGTSVKLNIVVPGIALALAFSAGAASAHTPAQLLAHRAPAVDFALTDPGIGVVVKNHVGALIRIHMTETTFHEPRTFTGLWTLYYWPVIGLHAKEYRKCGQDLVGNCVWTRSKSDLASPGHSKVWAEDDIECAIGQYYFKFTGGGVTSSGVPSHNTVFYPVGTKDGKKDAHVPPTRGQSHRIRSCPR
jgi:hypothetical protein